MILNYKWGLVRRYAYGSALMQVAFAVVLFCHSEFGRDNINFLYAILGFGVYFVTFEGL